MTELELFEAVLERSPADRAAGLDEACAGNQPLRQRLEALLARHEKAASFLEAPPAELQAAAGLHATSERQLPERPGTQIGPYKLREQIGEGGFGVVYVAEQEKPVRRKVALKIIKPGMDTKDVIARFEAERQALALMDHPNVARVLDAGATHTGRPYFVMELVHGVPITEFCDKNKLPTRDRLLLFADVCRAVQHAHQKGIIHRDLKPPNIMVTLHDGKPVAKVIDFGVSKALSQQLTEKSIYTAYGQMIGTPSYMSPEQAEMSGLGIDTRSDIYSLGVLLYELLTGKAPLDAKRLRSCAYAEILRIIREEEPTKPSICISKARSAELGVSTTSNTGLLRRLFNPKSEIQNLKSFAELDWIVMKCLEKDRARRYETAVGLARDIERYLRDEPVEACPPSTTYRLRKLLRKHRAGALTAAALATLLVLGAAVSTWQAIRATVAERQARAARQEAVAAKDKAESYSKRLSTATEIANDGVDYYSRHNWAAAHEKFAKAAQIEPGLNTIYIYRASLYTTLGLWEEAAEDYDHRFRLARRANSQTCYEHALLQRYAGEEPRYRQACQEIINQYGKSGTSDIELCVVRSCLLSPEPAIDRADLVRKAEHLLNNEHLPWHLYAAGVANLRNGDYEQSAARLHDAIDLGGGSPGGIHRFIYAPLAMALHRLGKAAEADEALTKAEQAIDEWIKAMVQGPVGTMPINWWDWLECNLYYFEAKTLLTGSPPADDPRLSTIYERALATITYGDAYTFMAAGREQVKRQAWDQAAASFVQVLDQLTALHLKQPSSPEWRMFVETVQQPEVFARLVALRPRRGGLWYVRGLVYASRGEWAKASADVAKARDVRMGEESSADAALPPHSPLSFITSLATLRLLAGDEAGYRELCAIIVREPGQTDHTPGAAYNLSRTCTLSPGAISDWSVAVRLANLAVAKEAGKAWYISALGAAQYRAGQHAEAIQTLEKSLRVHPAWQGRGRNYVFLSMACQQLGRHEEAQKWLAQTKAWQAAAGNKYSSATSNFLSDWLNVLILLPEAEKLLAAGEKPSP